MYINDNHQKWEQLHSLNQFRLLYPSETTIRFIKGNFKTTNEQKILDLGCGAGRHVVFLANEGFQTTGMDFSKEGLEFTAQRLQKNNLGAELVHGSITSLPFENESFNGLIAVSVLYYFMKEDIVKIIDEIYRVLKLQGKAFIVVRSLEDKRYGKGIEVEQNTYQMDSDFTNEEKMTIHFFTKEEIHEMFCKFSDVKIGFQKEGFNSLTEYDSDYLITVTK